LLTGRILVPERCPCKKFRILLYSDFSPKSCILKLKGETTMRRFVMALGLACVFSGTAFAGNIPTSGIVSPPPPPPENVQITSMGITPTTDYAPPTEESTLLSVLLTIMSVI
jgi:hypothetical protein